MYEWLGDYKRLVQSIAYMEFNLEQTEAELERYVGGDLNNVKLQVESRGARLEEIIQGIISELAAKRKKLEMLIELIETFSGLENQILRLKYIEGMTLEMVADELGYSLSHINKQHALILKMMRYAEKRNLTLS